MLALALLAQLPHWPDHHRGDLGESRPVQARGGGGIACWQPDPIEDLRKRSLQTALTLALAQEYWRARRGRLDAIGTAVSLPLRLLPRRNAAAVLLRAGYEAPPELGLRRHRWWRIAAAAADRRRWRTGGGDGRVRRGSTSSPYEQPRTTSYELRIARPRRAARWRSVRPGRSWSDGDSLVGRGRRAALLRACSSPTVRGGPDLIAGGGDDAVVVGSRVRTCSYHAGHFRRRMAGGDARRCAGLRDCCSKNGFSTVFSALSAASALRRSRWSSRTRFIAQRVSSEH